MFIEVKKMRNDDIDFDEIEAELHRVNEEERHKEAKLEQLRQKRYALMEEVDAIDSQVERIEDPTGENKDSVVLCGLEISGAWMYGNGRLTRLTPRPQ
jgi:hypothetical protein